MRGPWRKAQARLGAGLLVLAAAVPGHAMAGEARHIATAADAALPPALASSVADAGDPQGKSLSAYIRKRWGVDRRRAEEVVDAVQTAAAKAAVDPLLLLAVIARESKFIHFGNPKHLSPQARGLPVDPLEPHGPMQVAGRWHRDKMPRDEDGRIRPTSVRENVVLGARLLREYLQLHGGNLRRALQQYNGCRRNHCDRYPNHVLSLRQEFAQILGRRKED